MTKNPIKCAVAGLVLALGQTGADVATAAERFERARVFLEQNVQDQDAELKIEATGGKGGITSLQVKAPDGRTVVDFKTPDSKLGMRTLQLETPEPKNDGRVQADFPAGVYAFSGHGADGGLLEGSATLSHALPEPTALLHPRADAKNVPRQRLTLRWRAGKGLAGVVVVIEQEASGREIRASLAGDASAFQVPEGFLLAATEYKVAIGTVGKNGNQTFIESGFVTGR